jgi:hypothetical protein
MRKNSSRVVKEHICHRNYGVHTLSNLFALIQHAVGESHYIEGTVLAVEIFRHTLQHTCTGMISVKVLSFKSADK